MEKVNASKFKQECLAILSNLGRRYPRYPSRKTYRSRAAGKLRLRAADRAIEGKLKVTGDVLSTGYVGMLNLDTHILIFALTAT